MSGGSHQCQRCPETETFLRIKDLQQHALMEHRQRVIVTAIENLWLESLGEIGPAEYLPSPSSGVDEANLRLSRRTTRPSSIRRSGQTMSRCVPKPGWASSPSSSR